MATPLVSVILSSHNTETYIGEALTSLITQTFADFELLIIDDASTDGTWEVIKSFALQDSRIRAFRRSINCGLAFNLNTMLILSKANIIARADADDINYPNRLLDQYHSLTENNFQLVWSNVIHIDENGDHICKRMHRSTRLTLNGILRKTSNHIVHPFTMFRKSAAINAGMYDIAIRNGQDGDLWHRMLKNNATIKAIPSVHGEVRICNMNSSKRASHQYRSLSYRQAGCCLENRQYRQFFKYLFKSKSIVEYLILASRFILTSRLLRFFTSHSAWNVVLQSNDKIEILNKVDMLEFSDTINGHS